jgi:hypothetical protein
MSVADLLAPHFELTDEKLPISFSIFRTERFSGMYR